MAYDETQEPSEPGEAATVAVAGAPDAYGAMRGLSPEAQRGLRARQGRLAPVRKVQSPTAVAMWLRWAASPRVPGKSQVDSSTCGARAVAVDVLPPAHGPGADGGLGITNPYGATHPPMACRDRAEQRSSALQKQ